MGPGAQRFAPWPGRQLEDTHAFVIFGAPNVTPAAGATLLGTGQISCTWRTLMLNRRLFMGALAFGATLTLSPLAAAMAPKSYSPQAFAAAQAAGKPILLHITAPWCPTCKAQTPILSKLEATPKFKNLVVLNIDFDTSKDLLRKLRVAQQSTLIVFKGSREMGRSTGDTNPASIEALLGKAI
jgi:thioredoxin 1